MASKERIRDFPGRRYYTGRKLHSLARIIILSVLFLAVSCCLAQGDDGIPPIDIPDAFSITPNQPILPSIDNLQEFVEGQVNFNLENIRDINQVNENPVIGLANPASVYCESKGGRVDIRKNSAGDEIGYCIFPDGSSCEEWSFYNGECVPYRSKYQDQTM